MNKILTLALFLIGCTGQPSNIGGTHNSLTLSRRIWYGFDLIDSDWAIINRIPDIANGEQQYYLASNVTLSGGLLNLTVKSDTSQPGYSYTSGLSFWNTFSFQYGDLRIRAKFTGGAGPWPTIWMLGQPCQSEFHTDPDAPPCDTGGGGEIDIAEILSSNLTHVNQQIHVSGDNSGCYPSTSDVSTNWHTYGLNWTAGSLVYLIDGAVTCTVTTSVPNFPMFLILNVALGGSGGTINPATLPQTMQVSSVTLVQ